MWILLSDPELAGHLHADLQPDLSDAADRHAGHLPLKGQSHERLFAPFQFFSLFQEHAQQLWRVPSSGQSFLTTWSCLWLCAIGPHGMHVVSPHIPRYYICTVQCT